MSNVIAKNFSDFSYDSTSATRLLLKWFPLEVDRKSTKQAWTKRGIIMNRKMALLHNAFGKKYLLPRGLWWYGLHRLCRNFFHSSLFIKFDVELQDRWNAAVDAGCFAYKLDNIEARIVPGKYQVFVQVKKQGSIAFIRKLAGYVITFIVVANFSYS